MIALESFRVALFHVREFFVNVLELHFTKTTFDFQVGEDIRMALPEMIAKRKRWNSWKLPKVEGTREDGEVIKHQVNFDFVFRCESHKAVTACWRILIENRLNVVVVVGKTFTVPMNDTNSNNRIAKRLLVFLMTNSVNLEIVEGAKTHFAVAAGKKINVRRDDVKDSMTIFVNLKMIFSVESEVTTETRMLVGP